MTHMHTSWSTRRCACAALAQSCASRYFPMRGLPSLPGLPSLRRYWAGTSPPGQAGQSAHAVAWAAPRLAGRACTGREPKPIWQGRGLHGSPGRARAGVGRGGTLPRTGGLLLGEGARGGGGGEEGERKGECEEQGFNVSRCSVGIRFPTLPLLTPPAPSCPLLIPPAPSCPLTLSPVIPCCPCPLPPAPCPLPPVPWALGPQSLLYCVLPS
jgi:hypothetical protein